MGQPFLHYSRTAHACNGGYPGNMMSPCQGFAVEIRLGSSHVFCFLALRRHIIWEPNKRLSRYTVHLQYVQHVAHEAQVNTMS